MKRPSSSSSGNDDDLENDDVKLKKKLKQEDPEEVEEEQEETLSLRQLEFDDNLLYEVLRHVDPITLARSACVNKQWRKTAHDERLWELICTKQGSTIGCGVVHHRSVVTALGGFRRLFNLYIWPLVKPSSAPAPAPAPAPPPPVAEESSYDWAPVCIGTNGSSSSSSSSNNNTNSSAASNKRWGKDEVNLSLSLLSIRYFENMNFKNKGK